MSGNITFMNQFYIYKNFLWLFVILFRVQKSAMSTVTRMLALYLKKKNNFCEFV